MTAEQFVREHWEQVTYSDTAVGVLAGPHYVIIGGYPNGPQKFAAYRHTPEEAWSAAAEFTRERLEQIRQVEQEVGKVDYEQNEAFMLIRDVPPKSVHLEMIVMWVRSLCATSRILAREQAALAELKKGMR
jgi:hypothetical protein